MNLIDSNIEQYIRSLHTNSEPVLHSMHEQANQTDFPIIGPIVGQFLAILTRSIQARRIFELGSGFGYSAYWFASGTGSEGRIVCTDRSLENSLLAGAFFLEGGIQERIDFRVGEGMSILQVEKGPFDIIFNDIDKKRYPDVVSLAVPKLRPGGLLITDNTLWKGNVVREDPDEMTRGVLDYNRLVFQHPQLLSSLIPLRDGVTVSVKTS